MKNLSVLKWALISFIKMTRVFVTMRLSAPCVRIYVLQAGPRTSEACKLRVSARQVVHAGVSNSVLSGRHLKCTPTNEPSLNRFLPPLQGSWVNGRPVNAMSLFPPVWHVLLSDGFITAGTGLFRRLPNSPGRSPSSWCLAPLRQLPAEALLNLLAPYGTRNPVARPRPALLCRYPSVVSSRSTSEVCASSHCSDRSSSGSGTQPDKAAGISLHIILQPLLICRLNSVSTNQVIKWNGCHAKIAVT